MFPRPTLESNRVKINLLEHDQERLVTKVKALEHEVDELRGQFRGLTCWVETLQELVLEYTKDKVEKAEAPR